MTVTRGTRCLYLSYDGLLDPLGRSQVLPYLERFAHRGMDVMLVSFEKRSRRAEIAQWRSRLAREGIRWVPLRYHKWPSTVSTGWDVLQGLAVTSWRCRRWRPHIVHARGYVVALLALWVKRWTGAKFLFDIRGFWPEERVEGGLWSADSWLYRFTKRCERRFFQAADAVVILSDRGKQILSRRLADAGIPRPITVIPTCVDLDRFTLSAPGGGNGTPMRLAYVGSVGTWYLLREMAAFVSAVREQLPGAEWMILTNRPDPQLAEALKDLDPSAYWIEMLPHEEVPAALRSAHASLCFIKPVGSKLACCPTKVGESLACGVPVVVTAGTGDCDQLIERERVGLVIREHSPEAYRAAVPVLQRLLAERTALAQRCRRVASGYFGLEPGVDAYLTIYQGLMHGQAT